MTGRVTRRSSGPDADSTDYFLLAREDAEHFLLYFILYKCKIHNSTIALRVRLFCEPSTGGDRLKKKT